MASFDDRPNHLHSLGLSYLQGMISQGEAELSLISKNFFFTFFNLFLVFTVFGTAFKAIENADQKGDGFRDGFKDLFGSLKDTTRVAYILAKSLEDLAPFYTNLIVLQGLGLFPFRLLEFGSVALYPVYLMGAKTPRGNDPRVSIESCFLMIQSRLC